MITQSYEEQPKYLFELKDFFAENYLMLDDLKYFPTGKGHYPAKQTYYAFKNPWIENEYKGFVQHLVLDLHFVAGTILAYVDNGSYSIGGFLDSRYPEITSVSLLNYEDIYPEYLEYLSDCGYPAYYQSQVRHVNGQMEWSLYDSKTHYVSSFSNFYRYICSVVYPDDGKEYEKDSWDIRKLGIPYNVCVSRPRYIINYQKLSQPWLREAAKGYQYYRIQTRTMNAVLDDMKALNLFSQFLREEHPEINSMAQLTRADMEDYFDFLRKKNLVQSTYNRRISAIRTFIYIGNMLDLPDFPHRQLIMNSDFPKVVHNMPKYYTEKELEQMNAHIGSLPKQIGRMFFVLENCGMRISDLCSTPILVNGAPGLIKNEDDEYLFTYVQPKCHRTNTIPVSPVVGMILEDAIQESQKQFGKECIYIFAKSVDAPISTEVFSHEMNVMSKTYDLRRDDGSPLRIRSHTFRGTVATRYANCGIGMEVIRMMLGQHKLGVLAHYVTIHSDTMIDYLQPITEANDKMIRSIGSKNADTIERIAEPALIPLSNGRCSKSVETGICKQAYNCYSCRMFVPDINCLALYKAQLQDAQNNIAIAKLSGYERILEINTMLQDQLTRIISELEGKQNGG